MVNVFSPRDGSWRYNPLARLVLGLLRAVLLGPIRGYVALIARADALDPRRGHGNPAADAGRWDVYDEGMARLEALHDAALERGADTAFANTSHRHLEAWGAHRRGRSAPALDLLLSDPDNGKDYHYVMVLAAVAERSGQLEDAIRYYEALVGDQPRPYARYQLGGLYEQRGDTEKALESYRAFVTLWSAGDPEVQHLVDEARDAVARLGG